MKCAKCKNEIEGVPAISRYDMKSEICSDCGTREALEIIGTNSKEIEKVISIIHEQRDKFRTQKCKNK